MKSVFVCIKYYHYENSEILGVFSSKESAIALLKKEVNNDSYEKYEQNPKDKNRFDGKSQSLYIEEYKLED